MPLFQRYLGIDYSGAKTPTSSLKGLRVYAASPGFSAVEVPPPPGPKKYWTRRGVAEWLREMLREGARTLVGIDHAFSFPMRYFETHRLPPDWPLFLRDFQEHWPTDRDHMYVDFVRDGIHGSGSARIGDAKWRRLTEKRAGGAKSVFHFDVPGSVAKSTHAGLPWLLYLRQHLADGLFFWPFDGWEPTADQSVIAEAYPSLWSSHFPKGERTGDQHDAYSIAEWLRRSDRQGSLPEIFNPRLGPGELAEASVEGWILGVE